MTKHCCSLRIMSLLHSVFKKRTLKTQIIFPSEITLPFKLGGGRVVRWCWVNLVGQGSTALAVGAGGGCLDIFTLLYTFSSLSPSLWETGRYRLKYCLKGPLNPKQPTNQPKAFQTTNNERAAGGVSIFVNNNAPHSHIPLKTNLQAVAVSITLHRVITLCSIYIPLSSRLSPKDLDDLVPQLPGGGRVVRWCWVNFQCRGVLQF